MTVLYFLSSFTFCIQLTATVTHRTCCYLVKFALNDSALLSLLQGTQGGHSAVIDDLLRENDGETVRTMTCEQNGMTVRTMTCEQDGIP